VKLLELQEWAKRRYANPPHVQTLRRWAREGRIQAQRHGKAYYVPEDAEYMDHGSLIRRLSGTP
jgi:predicted site-specific integrase-resolvase